MKSINEIFLQLILQVLVVLDHHLVSTNCLFVDLVHLVVAVGYVLLEVAEEVLQVGDAFLSHFGLLDEVLLLLTDAVIFEFVDLVADHGYVYLIEFVDGLEVLLHLV